MLSIIICNRKPRITPELAENIGNTVGVEHEVIAIDNSNGQYSIFQAYNEGVQRARGNVLCFMHDDVRFRNSGWGLVVERLFAENNMLGALGVDGGHFMPNCPCSWTSCYTTSFHTWRDDKDGVCREYSNKEFSNGQNLVEVASIDGLWMCIRKSLFENAIRFDDKTFSGFHCYDSDICMQILTFGYHIKVTFDVEIIHNSNGTYNPTFFENIELWHKKWHNQLPVVRGIDLTEREQKIHTRYAIELMERLRNDAMLYSRLNSPEYRLGHSLLKPYRFIKRKLS
ncbi:MAG: hypothetical protein J6S87_04205 [Bacteroidales bacterium]|nr:hypothetical protein [Bacteroidales bacterium]